jgi:hypothetical protein
MATAPITDIARLQRSIRIHRFHYGLRAIRNAYRESRGPADSEMMKLETQWQDLLRRAKAGEIELIEIDEDGQLVHDYGDHMGDMMDEVKTTLGIVRIAYMTSLYHHWEKTMVTWCGGTYSDTAAFSWLKTHGVTPKEDAITDLRLATNTAKHGAGSSANQLLARRPDLFSDEIANADTLQIDDAQLEAFFDAVEASMLCARSGWL